MSEVAWETEYSVETAATQDFAWRYMSDVTNWHDPPAQFSLDGPFRTGTQGRTSLPGEPPRQWQLQDVTPPETYTVQFRFDGAILSCEWRFSMLPHRRTRLTQHLSLTGENASKYVGDIRDAFSSSLAPGMNKIGEAIDAAFAGRPSSQGTR
jgi:hypothetical protein